MTSTSSGPTPATSDAVLRALARAVHRPYGLPVPKSAVSLLGDAGRELLLASQRVVPQKLLDDGFVFRDILGLSDAEIDALYAAEVTADEPMKLREIQLGPAGVRE